VIRKFYASRITHHDHLSFYLRSKHAMPVRVGIDTGGTFTDLVALDETNGEIRLAKVFSTPGRPAEALLNALAEAGIPLAAVTQLIHGTTVATNALLEHKGAAVAFVTTAGFEDVPFIQRIRREYHYDLMWVKPAPLVERYHCYGAEERVDYRGQVVSPLNLASLQPLLEAAQQGEIEAVAVCYLFAYLWPEHELATARHLRQSRPELPVSLSSQLSPLWREYERASTTIADAYLRPLMTRYIGDLNERLAASGLTTEWALMKSNGGVMPAVTVPENPIHTIMSGPAGGMIACKYFAGLSGDDRVVTLDMGGTSCDVGLLAGGEQRYTTEFEIEWGVPINVPLIDIKSIGAGGGSIAWLDAGGLLHVGPESAGANPGPICYNRGGARPTVTDANVVLGRVAPQRFVPGYAEAAQQQAGQALAQLGAQLNLSMLDTALAMIEITNANMSDAIKLLTLERGLDPRRFALMAFGGAGPLHAAAIARGLGMPKVLVPPHPGMCSALGMLVADLRIDKVTTYPATSERVTLAELEQRFEALITAAQADLRREGYRGEPQFNVSVSMRYLGQNYEEDVAVNLADLRQNGLQVLFEGFHQHHNQRYGYHITGETIEIVALKVTALGAMPKPDLSKGASPTRGDRREQESKGEPPVPFEERQIYFKGQDWLSCPIYKREDLSPGIQLTGPAIVEEFGCTTLLEPDQQVQVGEHGILTLTL
jgi:N-methylhydantoinase A